MASQWLKARQTKYVAYATTYILIVMAAIVVVIADCRIANAQNTVVLAPR